MLVLSRNEGESLIINGNIEVCICKIKGGKVRIGIQAPRDYSIHRKEVHERIAKNSHNTEMKAPDA